MSVIYGCPLYTGVRYIRVSVIHEVSVIYEYPLYTGVRYIRVSVIYGCPLYTGVRYIGCLLCMVSVM